MQPSLERQPSHAAYSGKPSGLLSGTVLEGYKMKREMAFGILIVLALLAFELFNFSTTDFALKDLLGDLRFAGLRWSTILAIAFCGIDFAGIARLFSPGGSLSGKGSSRSVPEKHGSEPVEVWYLLGAWFLAATMNAALTWWGVSLALISHPALGNEILDREQLLSGVPVFVAILVWLIRILLIGTFTLAGDRLFGRAQGRVSGDNAADSRSGLTTYRPARVIGDSETHAAIRGSTAAGTAPVPASAHAPGPRPDRPAANRPPVGTAAPAVSRPPSGADASRAFRPAPKSNLVPGGDSNGKPRE